MSKLDTTRKGVALYRLFFDHVYSPLGDNSNWEDIENFIDKEFSQFGDDAEYGAMTALVNVITALLYAHGKAAFEGEPNEVVEQTLQRLAYGLQLED